ncbi:MAG TPA: phospho-N-acetylmuramoyl-pentapeptide-transferase [Candidatus Saccharimonadales bacterium]|jgi:phospho-N-acetylmuramoyl-pentapeptide-transferase|nr:phospho-N-acetylmuramoyl-pentapeptide-transferase [Candidatus Saccharimonadales bacterium]
MNTLHLAISTHNLIRILSLGFLGFALSMLVTPLYTTVAYKREWWKRQRTEAWSGGQATVYAKLHAAKHKRNIPTMAGLIFVISIALVTLLFNLSRGQTWLPLAGLVAAAAIGLVDDAMNIRSTGGVAGMPARTKFSLYSLLVLAAGWWFYAKLGVHSVYLPWLHQWHIGVLVIALFWLVVIATAMSVNITDGLDGLAGGLLTSSFTAYAIIAAVEHKFALAGFCLTVVGTLLSYTWFNIYPARFFMGDTGSFALGTALGIIALQTDTVYVLPIIGLVYVIETGSVIVNRTSKKLRHGKKVFLSSPIHHHFEAIGWPETKVTMRFWILGQVAGVLGLIVFLTSRQM